MTHLVVALVFADPAAGLAHFETKVRPLLARHCLGCHSHAAGKTKGGLALDSRGGWQAGGHSGPAVLPGDPDQSPLVRAVRRAGEPMMPPAGPLSSADVEVLVQWVRAGAIDPRAAPKPPAGDDWWSLRPLARPPVPGGENPIDGFVRRTLAAKKLSPSPEADRRTLLRRLTFDLHGLPPTPAELAAFDNDRSPDAYEKQVDRLLASPRYGERWARHWLDTVHFADTHGFEHDVLRSHAYWYRDYVIDSLNRDTPWPRFVREQLAADHFWPDRAELTPALGFLGAGPYDSSTASTAPRTFEYLDRDDMVAQTMGAFAGTTAACARCHDHKFDPVTQEDYYALQAVFAGVGKGDVAFDPDPAVRSARAKWERAKANPTADEYRPLADEWERTAAATAVVWRTLVPVAVASANGATLRAEPDGTVVSAGMRPERDTYTVTAAPPAGRLSAVRLEVLPGADLPKRGPGRQDNGNLHLSEFELTIGSERVPVRRATADFDQSGWTAAHAIDGNPASAWGVYPHVGRPHQVVFEPASPVSLDGRTPLVVTLKQLHGGGHLIGRFRLSITDASDPRAAALPAEVGDALQVSAADRTAAHREAIARHVVVMRAEAELGKLPPPAKVYAAGPRFEAEKKAQVVTTPKTVHLLKRGDIDKPGAQVGPGTISAIATLPGRFAVKDGAARRAALADWLVHPDNPLSWRTAVNRVWHYHFGRGLCDTPSDLGRMGGVPSHPELLDRLACEFRDGGGSLKKLHRLIATSRAYRQRSDHRSDAAATDADNRLFWRMNRTRLDADSYRDAVLAVSGRLDLTMHGPGVQHFRTSPGQQLTPKVDYAAYDWDSPGAGRRSIYRVVWRGIPDPLMDALDFPDLGQLAPARGFSASPLQSLALFNNRFVLHHANATAARLAKDADPIGTLFRLAISRPPTAAERERFAAHAGRHGLASAARVLFNSSEFLFVD